MTTKRNTKLVKQAKEVESISEEIYKAIPVDTELEIAILALTKAIQLCIQEFQETEK